MNDLDCLRCPQKITGSAAYVVDSLGPEPGYSHYRCYHLAHPPRLAHNFSDVANCPDDPVLARRLLGERGSRTYIVNEYNSLLIEAWRRRVML